MAHYIRAAEIGVEATLLGRRWRRRIDDRLRASGLTHARWQVLLSLSRVEDGVRQRELADRLGVGGPTIGRHLEELERLGLIERYPRPGDRRAQCVRLAARSKPLMERIEAIVAALQRDLLGDVSGEALETCLTILRILNLRLDRDRPLPKELREEGLQA
jgi:MarR family transcriptional regulator for hemolysin